MAKRKAKAATAAEAGQEALEQAQDGPGDAEAAVELPAAQEPENVAQEAKIRIRTVYTRSGWPIVTTEIRGPDGVWRRATARGDDHG